MNFIYSEATFTEAMTLIKMFETEHHRLTLQILKYLEDTATGKITQLIPKENLMTDQIQLEKLFREDQKLPIDFTTEDPLHIFKYSKISSTLDGVRIFMEVTIPIVERDRPANSQVEKQT